jgi:hypothetical protein
MFLLLHMPDSFGLDMFYIHEFGRSINHRFFSFWGTGGVWRKQAVADAGGFTWESVTEDILLSYRAYMNKGYEFTYVPQYPQCLEVPSNILAHIQQKHRWTKGYLQVFRIYSWDVLTSPRVPLAIKIEFFVQVLGALHRVFNATTLILSMHLKVSDFINSWIFWLYIILSRLESVLTAVHAHTSKPAASNEHYSTLWSRVARLRFYVPYCVLQMGMTVFESKAALEGLLSNDATFLTTPKKGAPTSVNRYLVDDMAACVGLIIALHQMTFLYLNDPFAGVTDSTVRNIMWFDSICFSTGLISVSTAFLWAKHKQTRESICETIGSSGGPLTGMSLMALVLLPFYFVFDHSATGGATRASWS